MLTPTIYNFLPVRYLTLYHNIISITIFFASLPTVNTRFYGFNFIWKLLFLRDRRYHTEERNYLCSIRTAIDLCRKQNAVFYIVYPLEWVFKRDSMFLKSFSLLLSIAHLLFFQLIYDCPSCSGLLSSTRCFYPPSPMPSGLRSIVSDNRFKKPLFYLLQEDIILNKMSNIPIGQYFTR